MTYPYKVIPKLPPIKWKKVITVDPIDISLNFYIDIKKFFLLNMKNYIKYIYLFIYKIYIIIFTFSLYTLLSNQDTTMSIQSKF